MVDFPTLSIEMDASSLKETSENSATGTSETDGGYQITRPRHTRRPRRTFTFKFRNISESDRQTLQNFWDARFGGSGSFNWTHPVTGVIYNVRFAMDSEMTFSRVGYGTNHRYDTDTIQLKEV